MIRDWSSLIWFVCEGDHFNRTEDGMATVSREFRENYTIEDMIRFRELTDVHYSMKPKIVTEKK